MPDIKPPVAVAVEHETAVGCHWRYGYETSHGRVAIDSAERPCTTAACRSGFDADRAMKVPIGRTVRLIVASEADGPRELPMLGIRVTATPGAIRESWFKVLRDGHDVGSPSAACVKDPNSIPFGVRALDRQGWDNRLARLEAKGQQ